MSVRDKVNMVKDFVFVKGFGCELNPNPDSGDYKNERYIAGPSTDYRTLAGAFVFWAAVGAVALDHGGGAVQAQGVDDTLITTQTCFEHLDNN